MSSPAGVRIRPRCTAFAVLGLTLALAGCGSSDPKPPAHPSLCGQKAVIVRASFGDVDIDALNPYPGATVPIHNVADISARSNTGCSATLTYKITTAMPISTLAISARIGRTTVAGTPALSGKTPGVEEWPGKFTVPLPAKATSATIVVDVPRFQETGKAPITPAADRRSVTLYLSTFGDGGFPASSSS